MKQKIKKLISAALAVSAVLSAFTASLEVSASEVPADEHKYIDIMIDSNTFRDFDTMYLYLYDATDQNPVVKWGSKNSVMTEDTDSVKWRYDLDEHGIELIDSHKYTVVFSSDLRAQTETMFIDSYESTAEYTAVFSGIYTWEHYNTIPIYSYRWLRKNEGKITGDLNGDGAVDILDATIIQKCVVDKAKLTDLQLNTADVNNDKAIDIFDANDIQKFAANKITDFKKQL